MSRTVLAGLLVLALSSVTACENPLDVNNPNNLVSDDLEGAQAVPSLVNGSLGTVSRSVAALLATHSTVSDELTAIGSRDAWIQLDRGGLDDPSNEFTNSVYSSVSEARFITDRAVSQTERFDSEGALDNRNNLARAYLYGGIIYTAIGDFYENFVLPDEPTQAVPPVGDSNMSQMYDQAIQWLSSGISVTQETNNRMLRARLLAQRARTRHARALWSKLNPPGEVPSDPLVSDAEMVQDAQSALDIVGSTSDWEYQFTFQPGMFGGVINPGFRVNERGALALSETYVNSDEADPSKILGISLQDPIDSIPDPRIQAKVDEFVGPQFVPVTVVSGRELHLLIAESRLAEGDMDSFRQHINAIRVEMDELSRYEGQISPMAMLRHARQANLFLENRRLLDMYRFGVDGPLWSQTSAAARTPGTVFPISITEIRSNPNIGG